ncbi:MAG TPA: histidine kinase dimerization/phospho-acceptor domain-containing protein, partial [Rhabdochlamydiaceae bacterium]|nr:histidine kinase dimerization/phospho-acceptor domain-containing protein [Rhabdochlamydiaceae bacterium]
MTGVQVLFFLILFIAALLALFGALPSLWVVCLIFIAGVLAFLSFRKTRKLDEQVQDLETAVDEIERDLQAKVDVILLEQEQQATLMSAISDAILAVDQEGNLLFYNSRFAMLFGGSTFNPQSRLKELFREPEILMAFETAFREGKMSQIKATPWTSTAGQLFFSLSVSPLRTLDAEKGGEIYGAVGVFHDVTDLKHAEQMRIDFVANVSHELRTPLTAIKGYTDTLYEDIGAGRPLQKEFLEIIHRNSNRLMSLIQDLLDLSALESTEILQKTEVSTEEVTKRVLQQLQGVFEAKKQKIKFQGGAPVVWADPRRVE